MDSKDLPLGRVEEEVDCQARLAQLRQFVLGGSLTDEELRYVKALLSRVNIDIIGELPIELVKQITKLLDLRDFVTCLAVSRRWRDKLLSTHIINAITNKLCPSLGQISIGTSLDPKECLKVLRKIGRLRSTFFESSLEKPFSWQYESYFKLDPEYHGHHEDMSAAYAQFGYQSGPEPSNRAFLSALYSNGRLAWLPKSRIIAIDNLWSRTRKVFIAPNGPLVSPVCQLQALGDRLLIVSMDRLLIAWDHTTNINIEKKLPGPVKCVTTRGLNVAIILFSGDVFLWEFGGKLSTLSSTPLIIHHSFDVEILKSWKSNLCAIFHPACNRKLFLASGYTNYVNSKSVLKRVVYEFTDTNHTETFEFEILSKTRNRKDTTNAQVQIQKVMPYRRDIIGFCERYQHEESMFSTSAFETYVEFDIYNREFSARINEEFSHRKFGWSSQHDQGDLDFLLRFYNNGFRAYSFQDGFDFKIGE
ncbi:hypothetical protein F4781DRAFT_423086 [Annulohypoxylon bovei var. microspora]|nr:hypothetical protein F4781DRAFT_423086 [Annulohypoxylon bovei var. microspora]